MTILDSVKELADLVYDIAVANNVYELKLYEKQGCAAITKMIYLRISEIERKKNYDY